MPGLDQPHSVNPLKIILILVMVLMLAATLIAAFFSARSQASDQIRLKDVALIQEFLSAYKQDYGVYPPSANGSPTNFEKYMEYIPVPPAAVGCPNQYQYKILSSGSSYNLDFCLVNARNGFHAGVNSLSPQ